MQQVAKDTSAVALQQRLVLCRVWRATHVETSAVLRELEAAAVLAQPADGVPWPFIRTGHHPDPFASGPTHEAGPT